MAASVETWQSYGALLARLFPKLQHSVLAGGDGAVLWASDAQAAAQLLQTMQIVASSGTNRQSEIDGLLDLHCAPAAHYGFRVRGALGEVLGFVLLATQPDASGPSELAAVHALIKPALDCLQSELSARAAIGELHADLADNSRNLDLFQRLSEAGLSGGSVALGEVPELALEYLPGMLAAILVPDRNLTICRASSGQSREIEAGVLAQLHRHLMTRAQLHGCTLVANRLSLDGSKAPLPYKAISTPIRDDLRRVVGVLAVFRLDTDQDFQLRDAEVLELLARKAAQIVRTSFDGVTGLLTQAAFVAQTQAKLAAHPGRVGAFGLLYIDIDQLNVVNENHGMPVGDDVIRSVAELLCRRSFEGSLVARIAGDRFAMFVPACGVEPAARIAEDLRAAAVRLSGARGEKPLLVSLSIGVARIAESDRQLEHAMAAAEFACRTAKERGRNRVEVFYGGPGASPNVSPQGRTAASFQSQVATALACDSLELLAQPILPLGAAPADPRFEILLRMRAIDGTRLSFEKLMNPAACPELARNIDKWIFEQSFARLSACRSLLREHPAKFSLNVSAASLVDDEFWRMAEHLVRSSRIDAGILSFEFPEEAALGQIARLSPYMLRLGEQGVSFTVDHFGRGIGSLSNLNSLPVSCIKIDGAFSLDLVENPRSQSMVVAITKLAQAFGMETIASHIETDAIRAKAAELGVDMGQGFFIGKPLALDDVISDLPLYSCFATSTGLFDTAPPKAVALNN
jgi:diguanylate cyclase (GGDEF)-like protein